MIIDRQYIFTLYQMGVGAIYNYLQQIENRVDDAEARVTCLQQALVEKLSQELASTKQTLARKSQQLFEQRQLNRQLQRRIRELERAIERSSPSVERDSHNSSLPPSLDLPWQKVKRTRSLRQKSGLKAGAQPGHPGTTLRQVAEPHEIVLHTLEVCSGCGTQLHHSQPTVSVRRQVFDICAGQMKVTEHRAETKRCSACGKITKARFPLGVRAPIQYGPGVLQGLFILGD